MEEIKCLILNVFHSGKQTRRRHQQGAQFSVYPTVATDMCEKICHWDTEEKIDFLNLFFERETRHQYDFLEGGEK
jgi:hypothetical protein